MAANRTNFRYSDFKCDLSGACVRFPGIGAYVRIGEKLGCGAYGDVFRGYRLDECSDATPSSNDAGYQCKKRHVGGCSPTSDSAAASAGGDAAGSGKDDGSGLVGTFSNPPETAREEGSPEPHVPDYAIKYFKEDIVHIMNEGFSSGTLRELSIMKSCNDHPNILKLVDVYVGAHPGIAATLNTQLGDMLKSSGSDLSRRKDLHFYPFKNSQVFMLALYEYCEGGDLGRAIWRAYDKGLGGYTLSEVKWYAFQLLNGLAYLHTSKIQHRDLKPNNIMLATSDRLTVLKIGDWGMGREMRNLDGTITPTACTLFYRPIEVILGPMVIPPESENFLRPSQSHRHNYGINADNWSAACIIAELATGQPLFHGNSDFQVLTRIVTTLGRPTEEEWRNCSRSEHYPFKGSLYRMQVTDRKERLRTVLQGRMDDLGLDLLLSLLEYNPHKRLSALEALSHPWFHDVDFRHLDALGVRNCMSNTLMGRFGPGAVRDLEANSGGITSSTLLSHVLFLDSDTRDQVVDAMDRDYACVAPALRQSALPVAIQYSGAARSSPL
ncbi:protein kinase domain containing protein, putative [Babesia bigemina]|uniref:Cyclin-dependent kinase 2 homolog n=1 Tax=Babesia bigemina TaxID=5866 RepID=A0A061DBM0_BABBI|nr:protein kinase domain containing protein, putative [Babesia bigemina]CDR97332.1 protein kinase domain containing protein, putative [Babesia bigemina]|eukprot:XP_012769518.1 protein kinase domain containing protein, putative [Babesia bigemina]